MPLMMSLVALMALMSGAVDTGVEAIMSFIVLMGSATATKLALRLTPRIPDAMLKAASILPTRESKPVAKLGPLPWPKAQNHSGWCSTQSAPSEISACNDDRLSEASRNARASAALSAVAALLSDAPAVAAEHKPKTSDWEQETERMDHEHMPQSLERYVRARARRGLGTSSIRARTQHLQSVGTELKVARYT